MDIEKARKASELITEINELSEYKNILGIKTKNAHFEFCERYEKDTYKVEFNPKYNPRFIKVVEEIIKELKDELLAL